MELPVGSRVILSGLQNEALNGKEATVRGWDAGSGRYQLQIEGVQGNTFGTRMIKPESVRLHSAADSDSGAKPTDDDAAAAAAAAEKESDAKQEAELRAIFTLADQNRSGFISAEELLDFGRVHPLGPSVRRSVTPCTGKHA